MKDEYIIINKTTLQKRIEELQKQMDKQISHASQTGDYDSQFEDRLDELEEILSQSTPLIPEIEKAFDAGFDYREGNHKAFNKEDYISNLKLDV